MGDSGSVNNSTLHEASDGRAPRHVFIDGVMVEDVFRCDTAEGWAETMVRHECGSIAIIGGEIVTEILHGNVTVVPVNA